MAKLLNDKRSRGLRGVEGIELVAGLLSVSSEPKTGGTIDVVLLVSEASTEDDAKTIDGVDVITVLSTVPSEPVTGGGVCVAVASELTTVGVVLDIVTSAKAWVAKLLNIILITIVPRYLYIFICSVEDDYIQLLLQRAVYIKKESSCFDEDSLQTV
jgi:hypothetical protein